jgi:hypothetical protein
MRMFYMTSARWAEVILHERRIKLARFNELNDPFELMLIDVRSPATRDIVKQIVDYFNGSTGICCFAAAWSSPVMWAHYADKHAGVCLGFDIPDELLLKVNYTDDRITVPFGPELPNKGLSEELLTKLLSTKATDWSYEREYRVLAPLSDKDETTGLYFKNFGPQLTLREIVIGHRCTWSDETASLLVGRVAASVRICKARPAFGRFEMVEQKLFKPRVVEAS